MYPILEALPKICSIQKSQKKIKKKLRIIQKDKKRKSNNVYVVKNLQKGNCFVVFKISDVTDIGVKKASASTTHILPN